MPKTASASDLPVTCAIPQSSRTMVMFLARCSQRAASGFFDAWNAIAADTAARTRTNFAGERRFIELIVSRQASQNLSHGGRWSYRNVMQGFFWNSATEQLRRVNTARKDSGLLRHLGTYLLFVYPRESGRIRGLKAFPETP